MFFMCFSDWIRKVIQVRVLLPCFSCRWKRPWLHNFDFELFQNHLTQSFISQYQTSKSALLHLNFLLGVWYDIKHTALLSCMCLSFLVSVKPVYSSHLGLYSGHTVYYGHQTTCQDFQFTLHITVTLPFPKGDHWTQV